MLSDNPSFFCTYNTKHNHSAFHTLSPCPFRKLVVFFRAIPKPDFFVEKSGS